MSCVARCVAVAVGGIGGQGGPVLNTMATNDGVGPSELNNKIPLSMFNRIQDFYGNEDNAYANVNLDSKYYDPKTFIESF